MNSLWKDLNPEEFDLLYIDAPFSETHYASAQEWLKKDRKRTVVFLAQEEGIKSPQVIFSEDLVELTSQFVFLRSHFVSFREGGSQKEQDLRLLQYAAHLNASEYADFGFLCGKNTLTHLKKGIRLIEKIPESLKGVPAIICGAGPSLSSHLSELNTLRNKAVIFSGGAALSAITPHIAGGVDPTSCTFSKKSPFFSLLRADAKKFSHGFKNLFFLPSSHHSPFEEWVLNREGYPEERYEAGWNVVTFLTQIAYALGCDPIIWIGVDGKEGYAKEATHSEQGMLDNSTKREWEVGLEWLTSFQEKDPERRWIKGSLESLKEEPEREIDALIKEMIQHFPLKKLKGRASTFKKSLKTSDSLIKNLLSLLQRSFLEYKIPDAFYPLEIELMQQPLFSALLLPNWKAWSTILARECNLKDPFEGKIHQLLFFHNVINTFKKL